jgi:signal transduction histidine kinase/FixJ family two-component response regulator
MYHRKYPRPAAPAGEEIENRDASRRGSVRGGGEAIVCEARQSRRRRSRKCICSFALYRRESEDKLEFEVFLSAMKDRAIDSMREGEAETPDDTVHCQEPAARALRVLVVEDSPDDAELLGHALRRGGYAPVVHRVEDGAALEAALDAEPWDVIVADYSLPAFNAPEALRIVQGKELDLPFLIVSGTMGEQAAVEAMRAGAHDCIMKDSLARLVPAIERELREAEGRRERRRAEKAQREEAEVSAALARVGRELIGFLGTPSLLQHLCQVTASVLRCDCSHTLMVDPSEDVFVPIAGYGATPEEEEIARVVKVPREMMSVLLERLEGDDVSEVRTIPVQTPLTPAQRQRVQLCTALRRDRAIIGVQVASRRDCSERFGPTEFRIARGVAQLASLALEHARVVDELARANRVKSEFVATISHELRTPLNVVMGYTDLLLDGAFGPLNKEQAETLQRILQRAHGLLELISATLDLGRIEAGRVSVDGQYIAVSAVLEALVKETRDWPAKENVALQWEVPAELPVVWTDPAKLGVVLKNLIANALKFTDRGQVTVRARDAAPGVEISVRDTGVGIPDTALPIVFEPFRQADSSSTRRYGGVGLGLYIVRRLLDLLGGTIDVESRVGEGSTFRLWIPLRAPEAPAARGLMG